MPKVEKALRLLAEDPFHPELHSHKLKGQLERMWACSIDYDNRILFMFLKNPDSGRMTYFLSRWELTKRYIDHVTSPQALQSISFSISAAGSALFLAASLASLGFTGLGPSRPAQSGA